MRKSILTSPANQALRSSDQWLDLEKIASVEISSEDPSHPFEDALHEGRGGWKASDSGPQTIRLIFDKPQSIRRIRLEFYEDGAERIQEFAVYVMTTNQTRREILRQQWNFTPGGSTREIEDYPVELVDITAIELQIDPGRHDKEKIASLHFIALA